MHWAAVDSVPRLPATTLVSAVSVDVLDQRVGGRSSSAAKKADAFSGWHRHGAADELAFKLGDPLADIG